MKCVRCGEKAEIETERGYLCNCCDYERLSRLNNVETLEDLESFWKEKNLK